MAPSADADGFIAVRDTRRGRRQRPQKAKGRAGSGGAGRGATEGSPLERTEADLLEYSAADAERLVASVRQLRIELKDCPTAVALEDQVVAAVDSMARRTATTTAAATLPAELACYGIGALVSRRAEQCQLAWLLNLGQRLAPRQPPSLFDPVLNATERVALATLGCRVPRENDGCRRAARDGAVLVVYMPHGGLRMYDNLLAANLDAGSAGRLCVIGNALAGYADSMLEASFKKSAPALALAVDALRAAEAPPPYAAVPGAFNDTRVQWLEGSLLPPLGTAAAAAQGEDVEGGHDFSILQQHLPALPTAAQEAVAGGAKAAEVAKANAAAPEAEPRRTAVAAGEETGAGGAAAGVS